MLGVTQSKGLWVTLGRLVEGRRGKDVKSEGWFGQLKSDKH